MEGPNGYYTLSIHPSQINLWYQTLTPGQSSKFPFFEADSEYESLSSIPENLKCNFHRGIFSTNARKKVTKAIDYLIYLAQDKTLPYTHHGKGLKFKLSFVTLTLSSKQIHSDQEIAREIFQPFLNSCRQKWNVSNYVWRAEKQSNGNIHYHIVTDRFIPWNELRNVWNKHQQRLGYIDRYRENQKLWHRSGFKYRPEMEKIWPRAKQLKAYKDGLLTDWQSPNSTDIHSIRRISNVKAYFVKYMTKTKLDPAGEPLPVPDHLVVAGRLWGSSMALSDIQGARTLITNEVDDEISYLIDTLGARVYSADYFSCIYFDHSTLKGSCLPCLGALFRSYLKETFPGYHPPSLFD